jgi:hypothetical protein
MGEGQGERERLTVSDYLCPHCGHELHGFGSSGFCEGCGKWLVLSDRDRTSKTGLSITIWELVAFTLAFIAKANGAETLGAFVVFMLVSLVGIGLTIVWQRAVKPTGTRLREEGLVGLGKTVESKVVRVLEPILYASTAS